MKWEKIDYQKYELKTSHEKIIFRIRRHGGDWLLQRKMVDTVSWIDVLRSNNILRCKERALDLIEDWAYLGWATGG